MSGSERIRAFTALTPVLPAHEQDLADALGALPAGDRSPFARAGSVHFARFVVLDGWTTRVRSRRDRRQPLQHLLFTSTSNSPAEQHLEEVRVALGPLADDLWGQCVGYPGHRDPPRFRGYLLHNRLQINLAHVPYDATVPEVREALRLGQEHLALARRSMRLDDEALLADFCRTFPL